MKRYEDFNRMFKSKESLEFQAVGILLERIIENYEFDICIASYESEFQGILDWLSEEVD